jgi:hypothetical protein
MRGGIGGANPSALAQGVEWVGAIVAALKRCATQRHNPHPSRKKASAHPAKTARSGGPGLDETPGESARPRGSDFSGTMFGSRIRRLSG